MSKTIIVPTNAYMSYTVSKEGYSTVEGNVFVDSDKVIDVVLEELSSTVTVEIEWHTAPAPISMYVDGVEYYEYETSAGSTTTHIHSIWTTTSSDVRSCSLIIR